jgi:hypothetical protein
MDPIDDPQLSRLLREWQVPNAPPSLDARVFGSRPKWWSFLLTGSVRVPVPVMTAMALILVALTVALIRPRPAAPAPAPTQVNLADFRPVQDLNVRVIRGYNDSK